MRVVVASGKGGVGKTLIASSIKKYYGVVGCDCDVDAPNMPIYLGVSEGEYEDLYLTEKARINNEKCIKCGLCERACKFGAIKDFRVDPLRCEGCGACTLVCPVGAISMVKVKTGSAVVNREENLVWGELEPGEHGSGLMVEELIRRASELGGDMVLDAPAGIGCPVNASIRNADVVIAVVEPTPPSVHDFLRLVQVVNHFGLPWHLVINKWDLNPGVTEEIEKKWGERLVGKVPYDPGIIEALRAGVHPLDTDTPAAEAIVEILEELQLFK